MKGEKDVGYIEELRALVGHKPLILVGAVAVIADQSGRILMQKRKFPVGMWGIPGGLMELGESAEETVKREVFEEAGLSVDRLRLINVYSGPQNYVTAKNGDQFYAVTVAYSAGTFRGNLVVDANESIKFEFRAPEDLPNKILKSHRYILDDYFHK